MHERGIEISHETVRFWWNRFGVAVAEGSVFGTLNARVVAVALAILLFVRPVCAGLSLIGARIPLREARVISSFGVRGLGSFYYIAVALGLVDFGEPRTLWMTSCLVVLLSIVMHGVSVTPIMW